MKEARHLKSATLLCPRKSVKTLVSQILGKVHFDLRETIMELSYFSQPVNSPLSSATVLIILCSSKVGEP